VLNLLLNRLFKKDSREDKLKFLIIGLGNIGREYQNTRHNIGFRILDALASASNIAFTDSRKGMVAEYKYKGRTLILLKPSTYMNLSGLAVNYWLKNSKLDLPNMLVLVDDIALPFGSIRIRPKGGAGGHNGLESINQVMGSNDYVRVRFGIGDNFSRGRQSDYVLGEWTKTEEKELPFLTDQCIQIIQSFTTVGLELTMTQFNKK
jgi:PTH1 family peptidyl-tRNA hydrolase